jgi:hypothetical protein
MNDNNDANPQRTIRRVTSTEAASDVPLASTSGDSKHPTIRPVSSALSRAREAKKNSAAPLGKRTQATYPIQKPPKSKYVRVHPDANYRQGSILTYTDTDSGEIYYVSPDLELPDSVADCVKITDFYAAQTHDGTVFIWFVHHSDTSWFRAAKKSVNTCKSVWRRVIARKSANTYDLYAPEEPIPEPDWSGLPPFHEMLENGFEDRLIAAVDHPAFRKLRGFSDDDE